MDTSLFDYDLPESSIAQAPIEPRDSSRLLDSRNLSDHTFADLPTLLDPGDLVVVNSTRVRKARLVGSKADSGGRAELLLLDGIGSRWRAMVKPARRLRSGSVLDFDGIKAIVVDGPAKGLVTVDLSADGDLEERIEEVGEIPLPPYYKSQLADPERYQTMFAKSLGSAAAPTAALHFTPAVVDALATRHIELTQVDLTVGIDTFRPIDAPDLDDHEIHSESFEVSDVAAEAVARCRKRGGRVVAVGTTTVRALESAATGGRLVETRTGSTDLFITPGYRFEVVDLLVTNFHVPKSSLVVMIAAFMGSEWRSTYEHALDAGYRFLSFGDAMLAQRS
ncbi:MAG: tRNA preQ1(34) S-adenosylmethionine ribosyltransferase-isomerase QueA [Acidimicrobiia bacterium]|nr:tRNA preQ1(34) S-adenosylmethionine ribosyltransferase-isomerase QueA [Acidimicrobiia bacterium]